MANSTNFSLRQNVQKTGSTYKIMKGAYSPVRIQRIPVEYWASWGWRFPYHMGKPCTHIHPQVFQVQPFHIVTPSPWPLLTSFALLILTTSAVLYMHGYTSPLGGSGILLLLIGLVATVGAMVLWFRDVVTEGTYLGDHTSVVQKGISLGVILFIVSEVFFFISVFWSLFHSSLSPAIELGSQWPPMSINTINAYELPLVNTVLLLTSGATVTYGHHCIINEKREGALIGLALTVVLALIFTICQAIEYSNAEFSISDGVYGSTFYFSTGFHGLHVLIGTAYIAVALYRLIAYHLTKTHHQGLEGAILYWHFVDVVWLFLYISVYWWGSLLHYVILLTPLVH